MKPIILTFCMIICTVISPAQEIITTRHSFNLENNKNIIIELEGEIYLNSWENNRAEVLVENIITGKVWGYDSDKSSKKNYDVLIEKSRDVVYIKEKPKSSSASIKIGIITLRSTHKHFIYLPESANISIISEDAKVFVEDNFSVLDINNKKGESRLELNRDNIKFLNCHTGSGKLFVNNVRNKDKYFKITDFGDEVYSISTVEGKINIKFND